MFKIKIKEGWLATGDLAEIQPSGLVAIKGRLDNLVKVSGEKVNLGEMEQIISEHEHIKEVAVVPLNDPLYGVNLLVCLEKDSVPAEANEDELSARIQEYFLPRKLPISVQFIDKIPHNPNGKLDRKKLLSMILSQ